MKIGLCYLPSDVGIIVSSQLNGFQFDYYFSKKEQQVGGDYRAYSGSFRIELTRLRCLIPFTICSIIAITVQGWCLQVKAPPAMTLIIKFSVGLGTGVIGIVTVYGQDIKSRRGGAVSAALNLVRCIFGSISVAVIQSMYKALNAGWTFVLLSGLILATPLSVVVVFKDNEWRDKRLEKKDESKRGKR
ncbi:uncharacterized protein L203_105149 [Cryptococcus depauperatus CBS 7841]|uniref:Major facilitator superfamily (MFS) profile domain-containing protein n=1 Tax=Cryptococcus depauperatus CBS 7841 TaxID=1295531 RepID=A0AAJ8JX28_9TREE